MSEQLGTIEELRSDYIDALSGQDAMPLWPNLLNILPYDRPANRTVPHLWKYEALLLRAGELTPMDKAVYWNWRKSKAKSVDEARKKGYAHTKSSYKGYVGQKIGDTVYAGFKPDKVNKSGYFEIYSEIMKAKGLAPLPTYKAIPEHKAMKGDELILTTYKVNVQTHSRTQNSKWLSEIYHDNPAWINPVTAEARGIGDGDAISIKSALGELKTTARVPT